MQDGADLYQGNDQHRTQRAEELLAFREALERTEAERRERSGQARSQNYQGKLDQVAQADERDQAWDKKKDERTQAMELGKEDLQKAERDRMQAGQQRTGQARDGVVATQQGLNDLQERGTGLSEDQRQRVEDEKRALQARETSYTQGSADARTAAKEKLNNTPADKPRAFADYNRSKLAQEYPEGVTEESYTEGNKVIIRRVVVNANKADEYSKVIAKWGTFYFKNGQSITEAIWSKETEG